MMPDSPPSEGERSQHLTCDAVDCVLVDRETIGELSWGLAKVLDELDSIRLHQQFVTVAQYFVSQGRSKHQEKALLFLDTWFERVPDQLKEVEASLLEARSVLSLILAASKLGGK